MNKESNMNKKSDNVNQHAAGYMLTKNEVCHLFCDRLKMSRSTYYSKVYPRLKFQKLGKGILGDLGPVNGLERMPYSVAIGILNLMTENKQDGDLNKNVLNKYIK